MQGFDMLKELNLKSIDTGKFYDLMKISFDNSNISFTLSYMMEEIKGRYYDSFYLLKIDKNTIFDMKLLRRFRSD